MKKEENASLHTYLGSATGTSIPCMHLCVVVWVLNPEADEPSAVVEADAGRKQLWEQDIFGMLAEEDHEDIALIYGKFYLVDFGYPNRPGYLAPYKGTMYHIQDFQDVAEPREGSIDQPETVDAPDFEDVAQMNAFRDYITDHLYNRD
ncbi:uncharacterized protein LOC112873399 [Panicum hallii]|uniref:uncharacterized protein LOC112873399 n=1 Tax=Panicum hallii TaxID=206008 RepID=UPI000DF4E4D3|nr:uncharacterized protein LOC112873399 [Panicum hallii]